MNQNELVALAASLIKAGAPGANSNIFGTNLVLPDSSKDSAKVLLMFSLAVASVINVVITEIATPANTITVKINSGISFVAGIINYYEMPFDRRFNYNFQVVTNGALNLFSVYALK